jgi:hypothetical protein
MKNLPILKDWELRKFYGSDKYYIDGYIYSDPKERWQDGTPVNTSYLKSINFENMMAQTRNTLYKLEVK